MESSSRNLLNDMAEHRHILKNRQNTYYSRFNFSPKTGIAFPTGVLFLLCTDTKFAKMKVSWFECNTTFELDCTKLLPPIWFIIYWKFVECFKTRSSVLQTFHWWRASVFTLQTVLLHREGHSVLRGEIDRISADVTDARQIQSGVPPTLKVP